MQLDVEETARILRGVGRRPAFRGSLYLFGAFLLAAVTANQLVVASPGRVYAARDNDSSRLFTARTQATTTHGTVPSDISPADVFMQAVLAQNGQLAWQQLCPALQAHVPASALTNLMKSDKVTNQGVQLQLDAMGSHAWSNGGAIHVYVVTVHGPPGADARTLFVLRTQASGCIDGILSA